ncbi:SIR2 family NAD-dependent protein deacylase [Propionivibrio sp.]|uniref:SIR2 family NAD-dependent protein deacylase n=1 Tax=Propionivibrio sp. TaxID=2212460 RepID=UPI00272ED087|nr:NAD-dependent deacylase [Propionivibrio sp.]
MEQKNELDETARKMREARRILFITGAGISADSGLPTYRGVGGLYNEGETEDGLSIEEALSGECFSVRPDITWKYLSRIERNCRNVHPNAAHHAIAELERGDQGRQVVVLTQNIDGLHLQAGSTNVIEIHGTLGERYCTECGKPAAVDVPGDRFEVPRCVECGAVVRPNVVLFGEMLPEKALGRLYDELAAGFGMVVVIGTTAVFPYISEPVMRAVRAKVPTVEINPTRTRLSDRVDHYLPMGAVEAMSAIIRKTDS